MTDGNPGVLKAIEEVFPQSLKQRCQKHRLENILGKAPKEIHDELETSSSPKARRRNQQLNRARGTIRRFDRKIRDLTSCREYFLQGTGEEYLRTPRAFLLALFTVGDVYASRCKRVAYAPFSAQRKGAIHGAKDLRHGDVYLRLGLTLIAKRREECSAGVLTKEPLGLCLEH